MTLKEIYQALADGKELQLKKHYDNVCWRDYDNTTDPITTDGIRWRVKPELVSKTIEYPKLLDFPVEGPAYVIKWDIIKLTSKEDQRVHLWAKNIMFANLTDAAEFMRNVVIK